MNNNCIKCVLQHIILLKTFRIYVRIRLFPLFNSLHLKRMQFTTCAPLVPAKRELRSPTPQILQSNIQEIEKDQNIDKAQGIVEDVSMPVSNINMQFTTCAPPSHTTRILQNPFTEAEIKREIRRKIMVYQKSLKHTLATTRFNDFTWAENCKMRQINPVAKCIYATPVQITSRIKLDSNVFVIEMNNQKDRIVGIGLTKNHPVAGKYSVHSVPNYNRFVYIGKWRIDVNDMTANELDILRLLEAICFRGINHSKRGQGITALPIKLQYKSRALGLDLIECICDMFKKRMNADKECG